MVKKGTKECQATNVTLTDQLYSIVDMKSQLVILLILAIVSLLLATNVYQQCDNLLQQCNQFKTKCTPGMITIRSCCHLADLPRSKAPSGVYKVESNCSFGSPFTAAIDVYCDMDTTDGGWMGIQRNVKDGVNTFIDKRWKDYEEGFGDLKVANSGMVLRHCTVLHRQVSGS